MRTQTLVERRVKDIKGVIECFDRAVLLGTCQAIGWTGAMEQHWRGRGTSFLEFNKVYANQLWLEVADRVRPLAGAEGIAIRPVKAGGRKEAILAARGRRAGVVCLLGAVERGRGLPGGQEPNDRLSSAPAESGQRPALLR